MQNHEEPPLVWDRLEPEVLPVPGEDPPARRRRDVRVVNLTPHTITITSVSPKPETEAPAITIPPSGTTARCPITTKQVTTVSIAGVIVPVMETTTGPAEGLPEPEAGTIYVVSQVVAEAAPLYRLDVFVPCDATLDSAGRITSYQALARVHA